MNKPMTRRGCLIGLLIWAVVMLLPLVVIIFFLQGEVAWERGPFVEDRLWLVRTDEDGRGERMSGLAYGAMRISEGRPGTSDTVCVTTRVYFWMWRGESESEAVTYCECYAPTGGGDYEAAGTCE